MAKATAAAGIGADFGLPAAGEEIAKLSTAELGTAIGGTSLRRCQLEWLQFQYAMSMFDRLLAQSPNPVATQRSLLDLEVQTALELQLSMRTTNYAAHRLLSDALCARDRLPKVYDTMRSGLIDHDRFHKIAMATALVFDEKIIAEIDRLLALEIRGAGGGLTSLSLTKTTALARRYVAVHDPDAERREREGAKAGRTASMSTLEAGMAQLSVVATAEDVRLVWQMLDAVIAGRCDDDPRTKAQARSDAAIALLQRKPFTCLCESDGCTAQIAEPQLDARAARIVVHVLCDAATLAGGDQCGYLDGYGPISGDHVRQIAERDDAVIHEHRLDDLLEPDPAAAQIGDDLDEAAVHRKGPRPDSPDECRADDAHPDPENRENDSAASDSEPESVSKPRFLIARTALPSDPYRPNLLVDLLARFLWGTCSIPGCERAAFACDLDHVAEFDNICPDRGGPTCICNLLPKCRFHHLMKTNLEGFVDELWIDADGRYHSAVTTPGGQTVEALAPNQWLMPRLAQLRCRHQLAEGSAIGTTTGSVADPSVQRASGLTRTEAKHARRRAERNANRDRRLAEEAKLTKKQVDAREAGRAAMRLVLDPESEPPF